LTLARRHTVPASRALRCPSWRSCVQPGDTPNDRVQELASLLGCLGHRPNDSRSRRFLLNTLRASRRSEYRCPRKTLPSAPHRTFGAHHISYCKSCQLQCSQGRKSSVGRALHHVIRPSCLIHPTTPTLGRGLRGLAMLRKLGKLPPLLFWVLSGLDAHFLALGRCCIQ